MSRISIAVLVAAVGASLTVATATAADDADVLARGRTLLEDNCARCHAVGADGDSPLAAAPRFRELHQRYPVEGLAEALAEGIVTGHDAMPQIAFEPPEIDAIIVYLRSLTPP